MEGRWWLGVVGVGKIGVKSGGWEFGDCLVWDWVVEKVVGLGCVCYVLWKGYGVGLWVVLCVWRVVVGF